ncbi:MAG: hypothetical protein KKC43_17405 [Alphaproteobacteria bacterium]|nr:hypothetical protein [Alphaproteobacteria bacterium]
MISRLHVSSFVGLTGLVWLIALWAQGQPVLTWDFFAPFSVVVGVVVTVVTLFNLYAWSWSLLQGWYVKRPDLRGTWSAEMVSSYINPETQKPTPPIQAYIVVRQTLTTLSFRLLTKESSSVLLAYNFVEQEHAGLYKLIGVFRNEPRINLQRERSRIHHGAFSIDIHGSPVTELTGHYWTDRETNGSIKLSDRRNKLYDTFDQADQSFTSPIG